MVVSKLGFICFSMMALGLNGCNPVAAKAALMVSEVKAERYACAKTPAKYFLCTFAKCKSSNISIFFQSLVFIFAKQTTSSPWSIWVDILSQ